MDGETFNTKIKNLQVQKLRLVKSLSLWSISLKAWHYVGWLIFACVKLSSLSVSLSQWESMTFVPSSVLSCHFSIHQKALLIYSTSLRVFQKQNSQHPCPLVSKTVWKTFFLVHFKRNRQKESTLRELLLIAVSGFQIFQVTHALVHPDTSHLPTET